ncbi:DUF6356 family protein [uncultured Tateyamaria sp.]|uniref:DUF6356 family protein n=1 Tax=uncultured Tateyamaria sp. TaxID=455651 RepID=UPI0026057D7E|nr:DUF6356 family protein [uncultured Tateyamaria sp.]
MSALPRPLSHVRALFVDHPAQVNESYWEHARFALGFAAALALAAGAALIHAIVPAAFPSTAGQIIRDLHHRIENRH